MANQLDRLSILFKSVYENLKDVLRENRLAGRIPAVENSADVCFAIEKFLDEICHEPKWWTEFERRATFVSAQCTSHTAYDQAKSKALSHVQVDLAQQGAQDWLAALRQYDPPTQIGHLWEEELRTKRILKGAFSFFELNETGRKYFRNWNQECQRIQRDANQIESHGCWCMHHIYLAAGPAPPEPPEPLRRLIEAREFNSTVQGGEHLLAIGMAADSLIDWIIKHPSETGKSNRKPRNATSKIMQRNLDWLAEFESDFADNRHGDVTVFAQRKGARRDTMSKALTAARAERERLKTPPRKKRESLKQK